jgi:hypothetical protein
VFFNNAGRDISGYKYLEVEAKGSVASAQSRMMIFFDDHPELTDVAWDEGWRGPNVSVNPFGKDYDYWGSMPLVSKSADGFEKRRIPLSWLTSSTVINKILIQHATWNKTANETWEFRSIKFTN